MRGGAVRAAAARLDVHLSQMLHALASPSHSGRTYRVCLVEDFESSDTIPGLVSPTAVAFVS